LDTVRFLNHSVYTNLITGTHRDTQPKTESGDNIVRNISNKL